MSAHASTLVRQPQRTAPADLRVRIQEGTGALEPLRAAWASLDRAVDSPMSGIAWMRCAARSFQDGGRLRVFSCERKGELLAVAPMVERGANWRWMEMLGVRELYEPTDLPCGDDAAREAVSDALAYCGLPLCLERLPADSAWIASLRRAYRRRGSVRIVAAHDSPYIALDEGWQEPEKRFNAGRQSDLRRARRRAEDFGPVTAEVHAPRSAMEVDALLPTAYEVEAAGWKGARGSALARDARRGGFFRRYAHAAAMQGTLRLCFLRIGSAAAAMQLAVEASGRFWLLKIGYHEQFSRCSPGLLLMLHTVAYAARKGLRSYELLGCQEPWTRLWTSQARNCVALRAYPWNVHGAASLASHGMSAIRRRLPAAKTA